MAVGICQACGEDTHLEMMDMPRKMTGREEPVYALVCLPCMSRIEDGAIPQSKIRAIAKLAEAKRQFAEWLE